MLFFYMVLNQRRIPDRSYEIGSVRPPVFLELDHWFFSNFGMVLEAHMKLCVTESNF